MVLAISAHPDDAEFGAGGTLHRLAASGQEVLHVALSPCEISVPGFNIGQELEYASAILGIDCSLFDFPVRNFPEHRQRILDLMIELKHQYSPRLVITHDPQDKHQDHRVVGEEALRAFNGYTSVLSYVLPWNGPNRGTCFSKLEQEDVDAKQDAIDSYFSQASRPYTTPDAAMTLARVVGMACGVGYAEQFRVLRHIDKV